MNGYIDKRGNYYEGDQQGQDQEVTQRPSPYHVWQSGAWADNSAAYYQQRRVAKYPPMADLADGMVKQSSTDPMVKAAGDAQVASYCAACLKVKADIPKAS